MPRTKGSDDLFTLIHALTPNEKGYFKKYAQRHTEGDTAYVKLFNSIDEMEQYDESRLKVEFSHLPRMKHYLFKLLLNALMNYYNNPRYSRIYLSSLYTQAAVLEYKGLLKQAIKEIKHGAAKAAQKNLFVMQYAFESQLSHLQAPLLHVHKRKNYFWQTHSALNKQLEDEIKHLKYRFEFNKLTLLAIQKTQGAPLGISESDIDFSLLKNPPPHSNLADKRNYYETLLAYYRAIENFKEAYPLALAYLADEKRQLKARDNDLYHYAQAITICAICSTELQKISQAEKFLEMLYRLRSQNQQVNSFNLSRYVAYKIVMYSATRQYAKGAVFIKWAQTEHPEQFTLTAASFNYLPLMSYSLYCLFMNKNYDECIAMLNEVNVVHIRKNALYTYKDLELLRLMLQAEMGNYDLMESMSRSASLKLKKYGLEDDYTKTLLRFFRMLPKGFSNAMRTKVVRELDRISEQHPERKDRYAFMGISYYQEWAKKVKLNES